MAVNGWCCYEPQDCHICVGRRIDVHLMKLNCLPAPELVVVDVAQQGRRLILTYHFGAGFSSFALMHRRLIMHLAPRFDGDRRLVAAFPVPILLEP
jgi:hypothetical protein